MYRRRSEQSAAHMTWNERARTLTVLMPGNCLADSRRLAEYLATPEDDIICVQYLRHCIDNISMTREVAKNATAADAHALTIPILQMRIDKLLGKYTRIALKQMIKCLAC